MNLVHNEICKRYFFHMGYNGYQYSGWQRQPASVTIQEIIEERLGRILKMRVYCIGCGRTDAKVHASQYFFHVDIRKTWDYDMVFRLNKILPDEIAIFDIISCPNNVHAQYNATNRTYHYYIHTVKNPFLSQCSSLYLEKGLQLQKMKNACNILLKYEDYYSFCKSPDKHNHTFCKIRSVRFFTNKNATQFCLKITANRFLRNMIRIIVTRILAVGRNEMSLDAFEEYFHAKISGQFATIAYPQGLHLAKVEYPFLNLPTNDQFLENISWLEVESS